MKVQKTYKNKTAGGYLKTAEVSEMKSGECNVTCPLLLGCVLIITCHDHMLIHDYAGPVVFLLMSKRAIKKLSALAERANDLTLKALYR